MAEPSAAKPNYSTRMWWVGLAILVPPLATWLSTEFAYATGNYPHASPIAILGMAAGFIAGVLLLGKVQFERQKNRAIVWIIYVPVMIVLGLVIGFLTACANGDCL